jgi:oxaloacetate decarboxylase alpha subunit
VARTEFWDTTLRDAHQSLWATRMTTAMMAPIARTMDQVGYFSIGLAASVIFDACVLHLREDPWERIRVMRRLVRNTPLAALIRGQNVLGWDLYPDEFIDLAVTCLARNGIRNLKVFDPLNDLRNLAHTIRVGKAAGLGVVGCVVYTVSPIHTDAYFVEKARELVRLGVDGVEIKDPSGLLTPERVAALVPAVRAAIGDARLHLHTHCTSGMGPAVYLRALPLGVDVFHTAISPLANGSSNPPVEPLARQAREMGHEVAVSEERLGEVAAYFRWVAYKHGKPLGRPVAGDPELFRHHLPGGMISNLVRQLSDLGLGERLPEVLREVVQVRRDLGYPIMVSPISQFVAVQALFNVIHGERYAVVPTDIRRYALGWYGETAAPIEPDVLDRLTGGAEPIRVRPGEALEPCIERFRRQNGPFGSDEELILALLYRQAGRRRFPRGLEGGAERTTPLVELVAALAGRAGLRRVRVEKGELRLAMTF